jgi:hypothetical protein
MLMACALHCCGVLDVMDAHISASLYAFVRCQAIHCAIGAAPAGTRLS